jgi:hypothetical protein
MSEVDKRNRLDDDVFEYRETKDSSVHISWYGKRVMTLKGPQARKFLAKIADLEGKEAQLVMAKITGNFKHGNERAATQTRKSRGDRQDYHQLSNIRCISRGIKILSGWGFGEGRRPGTLWVPSPSPFQKVFRS